MIALLLAVGVGVFNFTFLQIDLVAALETFGEPVFNSLDTSHLVCALINCLITFTLNHGSLKAKFCGGI
jgi:hypothetical protein